MKHFFIVILISKLVAACNNHDAVKKSADNAAHIYPTLNYLNIRIDSAGKLPSNPYILEFTNGNKQIVFLRRESFNGCNRYW